MARIPLQAERPGQAVACAPIDPDRAIDDSTAQEIAATIGALADPTRLRLLSLIASREEVCACDLVGPLGRSQPTVSHHLRVLFEAGLVGRERRGTWIWYRAEPAARELLGAVLATRMPTRA